MNSINQNLQFYNFGQYAPGYGNLRQINNEDFSYGQQKQQYPNRASGLMKFLDLRKYKTDVCKQEINHNRKLCMYYHDTQTDRRRTLGKYSSQMCLDVQVDNTNRYVKNEQCVGEECNLAHNQLEIFYHPDKYKSQFCKFYPNKVNKCEFGEQCAFSHSKNEISIDLIHLIEPKDHDFYGFYFKTVQCPWNMDHQIEKCVYAHNQNDARRKIESKLYSSSICSDYKTGTCFKGQLCEFSHNLTESLYHPSQYKTNACIEGYNCNDKHCSYYHGQQDKRHKLNQFFLQLPRNRKGSFGQPNYHKSIYSEYFVQEQQSLNQIQMATKLINNQQKTETHGGYFNHFPSGVDIQQSPGSPNSVINQIQNYLAVQNISDEIFKTQVDTPIFKRSLETQKSIEFTRNAIQKNANDSQTNINQLLTLQMIQVQNQQQLILQQQIQQAQNHWTKVNDNSKQKPIIQIYLESSSEEEKCNQSVGSNHQSQTKTEEIQKNHRKISGLSFDTTNNANSMNQIENLVFSPGFIPKLKQMKINKNEKRKRSLSLQKSVFSSLTLVRPCNKNKRSKSLSTNHNIDGTNIRMIYFKNKAQRQSKVEMSMERSIDQIIKD